MSKDNNNKNESKEKKYQKELKPKEDINIPPTPLHNDDGYDTPKDGYDTPKDGYDTPKDGYVTPENGYLTPDDEYGTPEDGYGTPEDRYGTPEDRYGTPEDRYKTPTKDNEHKTLNSSLEKNKDKKSISLTNTDLLKNAHKNLASHFKKRRDKAYREILEISKEELGKVTSNQKRIRKLEKILDGNFCIGEAHNFISSKRFLIENMPLLKKSGFKVLFMEHLYQLEEQEMLDRYFESDNNNMPQELREHLNRENEGHGVKSKEYNFLTLVLTAKKHGIKIVALENRIASHKHENLRSGENRIITFNYQAAQVIKKYEANSIEQDNNPLKWVALVGEGHVNNNQDRFHKSIPGIADIVHCQDISMTDHSKKTEIISGPQKILGKGLREKENIKASIWINADPNSSLELESLLKINISHNEAKEAKLKSPYSKYPHKSSKLEIPIDEEIEDRKEDKTNESVKKELQKNNKSPSLGGLKLVSASATNTLKSKPKQSER